VAHRQRPARRLYPPGRRRFGYEFWPQRDLCGRWRNRYFLCKKSLPLTRAGGAGCFFVIGAALRPANGAFEIPARRKRLAWFHEQVQLRLKTASQPPKPFQLTQATDSLGGTPTGRAKLFFGLRIEADG